jgi:hypothetical protein
MRAHGTHDRRNRLSRGRLTAVSFWAAGCLGIAGCASGQPPLLTPSALPSPTAISLPKIELPKPSLPSLPVFKAEDPVLGSPTELYTRIARGAMECWFAAKGPLKGRYVYHADADPASQGGKAEIVIHAIDPTSPNPRGLRAFRISIIPSGEKAKLEIENLKLPEGLAASMTGDIHRWAAAGVGCDDGATAGWAPRNSAAETAAATPAKEARGKR